MAIIADKDKKINLDAIDKKILYHLSLNYRIPRNKLAKLINISPQRLNHRIKTLEENFIEPYVCINYPKLSINSYLLFFESLDEESIKMISKSNNTYYLLRLVGKDQYLAIILTEDIIDFCSRLIPNTSPKIYSLNNFFPDSWNGFNIQDKKINNKVNKNHQLTNKDLEILYNFIKNPTISLLELSNKLKRSRITIKESIKKLEESNIIQKYKYSINIPKTGFLTYFIHLDCKPNKLNKIIKIIRADNYSGFLFQSLNHLFFSYIVPTSENLFEFINKLEREAKCPIEFSQNTGNYIVNPAPKYAQEVIKKSIEK
jgi:DNA-binding Lrp family transcriptional regulator